MGGPAANILTGLNKVASIAKAAAATVADKVDDHIDTLKGGKIRVYVAVVDCGDGSYSVSLHNTAVDAAAVTANDDVIPELNNRYFDIDPSDYTRV